MNHLNTNFKHCANLDLSAVSSTQIKFTYVGEQEKATPSVIILPTGARFDPAEFRPFRTQDISYGNDDVVSADICQIHTREYERIFSAVIRTCSGQSRPPSRPFVSVTIIEVGNNVKGCEVILGQAATVNLLDGVLAALDDADEKSRTVLRTFRGRIL
jgi:hypothetical protein